MARFAIDKCGVVQLNVRDVLHILNNGSLAVSSITISRTTLQKTKDSREFPCADIQNYSIHCSTMEE